MSGVKIITDSIKDYVFDLFHVEGEGRIVRTPQTFCTLYMALKWRFILRYRQIMLVLSMTFKFQITSSIKSYLTDIPSCTKLGYITSNTLTGKFQDGLPTIYCFLYYFTTIGSYALAVISWTSDSFSTIKSFQPRLDLCVHFTMGRKASHKPSTAGVRRVLYTTLFLAFKELFYNPLPLPLSIK